MAERNICAYSSSRFHKTLRAQDKAHSPFSFPGSENQCTHATVEFKLQRMSLIDITATSIDLIAILIAKYPHGKSSIQRNITTRSRNFHCVFKQLWRQTISYCFNLHVMLVVPMIWRHSRRVQYIVCYKTTNYLVWRLLQTMQRIIAMWL